MFNMLLHVIAMLALVNTEPYARLDIFCCRNQTSFLVFFRHDLHFPRVLRPYSLMGTVQGEGRRGRCLRVKVAVGFKYS